MKEHLQKRVGRRRGGTQNICRRDGELRDENEFFLVGILRKLRDAGATVDTIGLYFKYNGIWFSFWSAGVVSRHVHVSGRAEEAPVCHAFAALSVAFEEMRRQVDIAAGSTVKFQIIGVHSHRAELLYGGDKNVEGCGEEVLGAATCAAESCPNALAVVEYSVGKARQDRVVYHVHRARI